MLFEQLHCRVCLDLGRDSGLPPRLLLNALARHHAKLLLQTLNIALSLLKFPFNQLQLLALPRDFLLKVTLKLCLLFGALIL